MIPMPSGFRLRRLRLGSALMPLLLLLGLAIAAIPSDAATVSSGGALQVTQSTADVAIVGQPLQYTISLTNTSASTASSVTLGARLPLGTKLTTLPNPNLCARTNSGGRTGFGCVVGDLAAGASASFTYTVTPSTAGTLDSLAVAQGFVGGVFLTSQVDLVTSAAVATTTTTPPPVPASGSPDVQITGSANTGRPLVGTTFVYAFQVKNGGNLAAQGVTLSDTLPSGLTYVGAATSVGSCTHDVDTLSCTLGDLAVGAQANVQLAVQAGTAGTVINGATAADTNGDSKPANNTVDITVQAQ